MKRRGKPGDLLVRVKIVTPKSINSEQRELYQKLAELEGKSSGGGGFFPASWEKRKVKSNSKESCLRINFTINFLFSHTYLSARDQ